MTSHIGPRAQIRRLSSLPPARNSGVRPADPDLLRLEKVIDRRLRRRRLRGRCGATARIALVMASPLLVAAIALRP